MKHALPFLVLALLWSASVSAQITPTDEQKELNRQAYQSMANGDHDAAIDMYLRSLQAGELNVTWLNLGRAYQKSGQCRDAFQAYEKVEDAPQVQNPVPEVVNDSLARFLGELESQCPTQIVTRCLSPSDDPSEVTVTLDGETDYPCGVAIEVEAGTHIISGTGEAGRIRKSVLVERGQSVQVDLHGVQAPAVELASTEDTSYDPQPPRTAADEVDRIRGEIPPVRALDWGGVALIGGGLLVGLTGMVFDGVVVPGWPAYAMDFQVQAGDFLPVGLYAGGLTMIVLGIIDLVDGPERPR